MNKNLHHIEDLFFSGLNDHEETPPEKVWEEVDKRLDKESVISIKRKYTSLKRIVIILVFLLSGFVIYTINTKENTKQRKEIISRNVDKIKLKERLQADSLNNNSGINNLVTGKASKKSIGSIKKNETEKAIRRATESADNSVSQNSFTSETANSAKIILKNKLHLTTLRKTRLTSEPFDEMKMKNAGAINETASGAPEGENLKSLKITFRDGPGILLMKPLILSSLDSISTNKDLRLIALKNRKPSERINNSEKSLNSKTDKNGRFLITPFFSPDIAWYHLSDKNINNQSTNAAELEKEETHEFSYTYGFLVDHKVYGHWGIQSGVSISKINIVAEPGILYAQPDNYGKVKYRVNTSSGYGFVLPAFSVNPAVGDSLYAFTSSHSLEYLGIPVAATYSIIKNKFTFSGRAGISANLLLNAKLETTVEKGFDNSIETTNNIQGLKNIYFSGLAGLGVAYQLRPRTSLTFYPALRFAINSINKNDPVKSFPMSFGSLVGLKIEL